jgi:hypothetical protein
MILHRLICPMCSTNFSAAGSALGSIPKSPLGPGPGIEVTVTVVIAGVNPNSFRIEKRFEGRLDVACVVWGKLIGI